MQSEVTPHYPFPLWSHGILSLLSYTHWQFVQKLHDFISSAVRHISDICCTCYVNDLSLQGLSGCLVLNHMFWKLRCNGLKPSTLGRKIIWKLNPSQLVLSQSFAVYINVGVYCRASGTSLWVVCPSIAPPSYAFPIIATLSALHISAGWKVIW